MSDLEILEKTDTDAVMRLRQRTLAAGEPFMINSKELPPTQGYLEYPDRTISLVSVAPDLHSFNTVRKLSDEEVLAIRHKFNLQ